MNRNQWKKACEDPQQYHLVDSVSHNPIALIEESDACWGWERTTTNLLHGAPAASGTAEDLLKAKVAVLRDLPNEI